MKVVPKKKATNVSLENKAFYQCLSSRFREFDHVRPSPA